MNSMQDLYLKSLNPHIAVKIEGLTGGKYVEDVIKNIHSTISYKYKTFLDKENGVIYVGKRI